MTQTTQGAYAERLSVSLPAVRDRIDRAVAEAGRRAGSVRLVAVTKSHPLEAVEAALEAGLTDLGENRIEELETKVAAFGAEAVRWHMIGHLQSRKAKRAVAVAHVVHSVDTLRLAAKLSQAAVEGGRVVRVLAQVNTAGEESKSGFEPGRAEEEVLQVAELPGLRVDGLMTMAPFVQDQRVLSDAFAGLRTLSEALRGASDSVGPDLSMGMTNDLEIAIREGSTMVRIGTALFGPRGYAP